MIKNDAPVKYHLHSYENIYFVVWCYKEQVQSLICCSLCIYMEITTTNGDSMGERVTVLIVLN